MMRKTLMGISLIALVLAAGFYTFRNLCAEGLIASAMTRELGVPVHIGRVRAGLLSGQIFAEGIMVENPPDFDNRAMLYIPRMLIIADLTEFLKKRPHIELIDLEVDFIRVLRNRQGILNIEEVSRYAHQALKTTAGLKIDFMRFDIRQAVISDPAGRFVSGIFPVQINDVTFRDASGISDVLDTFLREMLSQAVVREKSGEILEGAVLGNLKRLTEVPGRTAETAVRKTRGALQKIFLETRSPEAREKPAASV